MNKSFSFFTTIVLFFSHSLFASETIQSARPGQAIGAGTLDPGYIQIQS